MKVFIKVAKYLNMLVLLQIYMKKILRVPKKTKELRIAEIYWTLEDDFYTWIYLIGLTQNKKLSESLLQYEAFTDIEFNEKKSFNCQAYSAAFYVSLVKNKKMSLNKIQSPVDFKSIAPKKFIKNYQPQLL